jgi:hypothetical protein
MEVRNRTASAPAADAVALVILLGLAAYVSVVNFWYTYDDAMITYRMARNFALGRGLVYNVGEWHLGTTAPLYGLILGVLGRVTGPDTIPAWGGLISSLSLTLGGLALYTYGRLHRATLAGALAGMFYVTNPMLFIIFGGEMLLQVAVILWAFVAYRTDRLYAATALLAIATLTRGDGLFATAVLGLYDLVGRRRLAWRAWLLFAAIVAPFALMAWAFYGAALPGTLSAKMAQRASGGWTLYFGRGLRVWFRAYLLAGAEGPTFEFFSLDPRTLSFWAWAGLAGIFRYRFWWLPLAWIAVVTMAYRTLQVPFYHWYAAPAITGLTIVMGCGVAGLVSLVHRAIASARATSARGTGTAADAVPAPAGGAGVLAVVAGTCLVLIAGHLHVWGLPRTTHLPAMAQLYADVGRWLHDHTPPGSSVGYYEIGFIGYYSDRRMVDALGLIDPAVPPHVAQRDFAWAFRQHRPTYLLEKPGADDLNAFRKEPWFAREYRELRSFAPPGEPSAPGGPQSQHDRLVLYERIGAAATPSPGQ